MVRTERHHHGVVAIGRGTVPALTALAWAHQPMASSPGAPGQAVALQPVRDRRRPGRLRRYLTRRSEVLRVAPRPRPNLVALPDRRRLAPGRPPAPVDLRAGEARVAIGRLTSSTSALLSS